MNKLTKLGVTALCGSLAAVTYASAGDLDVTGSATMTYSSNEGETTGNPVGIASAITFKGSGELDNGWGVSMTLADNDQSAYSTGGIAITTNSFGTFEVSQAEGGSALDTYDDKMPSAWEETWGTSLSTGVDLISGVGAGTHVNWKLPTVGGVSIIGSWSGKNDGVLVNDKAKSADGSNTVGRGIGLSVNINPLSGLNIFAGGSETERPASSTLKTISGKYDNDHKEATVGTTLALGPITGGIQKTGEFTGKDTTAGEIDYYDGLMWGVSFNINDDLSVSYGEMSSKQHNNDNTSVRLEVESIQVAWTIGGASIKIAETKGTNLSYSTTAYNDRDATTVMLSLAF